MALRREDARPRLRVVRGRPRKSYAVHCLDSDDATRLAAHLAATYHDVGPSPHWFKPFPQERLGDSLTIRWLAQYRLEHPDDWKRMLRTLRKSGGSTTWSQATAYRKSRRDVGMLATGENVLSDGDEPVYLHDLAHLMELHPGINRAQKLQPINRDGAYIDPGDLARPDWDIGNAQSSELNRLRFHGPAELRRILEAIAVESNEDLEASRDRGSFRSAMPRPAVLGHVGSISALCPCGSLVANFHRPNCPINVTFVPISGTPSMFESERTHT